jgi:hypothetical protein
LGRRPETVFVAVFIRQREGDVSRPESLPHDHRLDRWSALGGIAALGALALGFPRLASAATRVPVWRLDAVHRQGTGPYSSGCAGCRACRRHALNRIFATHAAAAGGRAHAGCDCKVVRSSMSEATFVRLFGPVEEPTREVVDRRWASARRVLKSRKAA